MASFFLYPACGNGGMVMRVDCNNYRCAHNKHGICLQLISSYIDNDVCRSCTNGMHLTTGQH